MDINEFLKNATFPWAFRIAFIVNVFRETPLKNIDQRFGLSRPEWTVLLCVSTHEGIIARDISGLTGQPRNSISRAVISLETKGLIHRDASEVDKRQVVLTLTKAGKEIFAQLSPAFEGREAAMLACLDEDERIRFCELVKKIADHVAAGNLPDIKF